MRLPVSLITLAGLFSVAYAGQRGTCNDIRENIAACPQSCWDTADYGNCSVESDASCLCNEPAFVHSLYNCIETTCGDSEIAAYQEISDQLCATAIEACFSIRAHCCNVQVQELTATVTEGDCRDIDA
ncbi:hypothetical protein DAEQUDRAFT_741262 [Daedalea quercina L-15889]|uniref:CFEM domain-containing protein n=1 Tax=Daedalea quercina L-15889 TaxID=1314783 RepID=A0A165LHW6_9APHY|nr:hypothetical protein DAEQUDRAFT_741262 [Daedalea quercina L-15889]